MQMLKFLSALLLAVSLAGCAPVDSLNPLYSDKDVVFDEALLGQWGTEQDGLNVARLGVDGYQFVTSSKDDQSGQTVTVVFDAHLVNLQGHRFLDLVCKQCAALNDSHTFPEVHITPQGSGLKIEPRLVSEGLGVYMELLPGEADGDDYRFSMRPRQAHWFFKVALEDEGRTLKLVQLDDSWIDQQIRASELIIDHEFVEGTSTVLTASTPDLQRLVLDHVNDEQAFCGDTTYKRAGADPLL